jgi:hypothetical protein
MLNSAFFGEEAAAFAARLRAECGDDAPAVVRRALELALCREPTDEEVARGAEMIAAWQQDDGLSAEQATAYYCLMVFNLNEFIYLD